MFIILLLDVINVLGIRELVWVNCFVIGVFLLNIIWYKNNVIIFFIYYVNMDEVIGEFVID